MTEPNEHQDPTTNTGLPMELEPEEEESSTDEQANLEAAAAAEAADAADKAKSTEAAADTLKVKLPTPRAGGAPPWVMLPDGFRFPREKQVLFLRFKSAWTDAPWKGEPMIDPATGSHEIDENGEVVLYRQCVCWPINTADKKLAIARAQRDPNRAGDELAKQMIRVHDGLESDWGVVRGNGIEMFWNELGEKCRHLVTRIFTQLHVLDTNGTRDFLTNCIEVRSTGS